MRSEELCSRGCPYCLASAHPQQPPSRCRRYRLGLVLQSVAITIAQTVESPPLQPDEAARTHMMVLQEGSRARHRCSSRGHFGEVDVGAPLPHHSRCCNAASGTWSASRIATVSSLEAATCSHHWARWYQLLGLCTCSSTHTSKRCSRFNIMCRASMTPRAQPALALAPRQLPWVLLYSEKVLAATTRAQLGCCVPGWLSDRASFPRFGTLGKTHGRPTERGAPTRRAAPAAASWPAICPAPPRGSEWLRWSHPPCCLASATLRLFQLIK